MKHSLMEVFKYSFGSKVSRFCLRNDETHDLISFASYPRKNSVCLLLGSKGLESMIDLDNKGNLDLRVMNNRLGRELFGLKKDNNTMDILQSPVTSKDPVCIFDKSSRTLYLGDDTIVYRLTDYNPLIINKKISVSLTANSIFVKWNDTTVNWLNNVTKRRVDIKLTLSCITETFSIKYNSKCIVSNM